MHMIIFVPCLLYCIAAEPDVLCSFLPWRPML